MSVIQKTDTFGQVAFDQSFHFLGKGTRITQRRTFLNARSESMSSVIPSKTPFLSLIILKSVVPGQKSSVCIHRIIPTFISIHFINFEI